MHGRPPQTGFVPVSGHHIQLGKVLMYVLHGFPFRIVIHREGIEIEGKTPVLPVIALGAISDVLRRAQVHYIHLASFPAGEPQSILDEEEVIRRADIDEFVAVMPEPTEPINRPRLVVVS